MRKVRGSGGFNFVYVWYRKEYIGCIKDFIEKNFIYSNVILLNDNVRRRSFYRGNNM